MSHEVKQLVSVLVCAAVVILGGAYWYSRHEESAPPPPTGAGLQATVPRPTTALPDEERVEDPSPAPVKPALEFAFVSTGGQNREGFNSYDVDVTQWDCAKKPRPAWLAEGKTVWLYGSQRLGRGKVGRARVDPNGGFGGGTCTAEAELEGVRSRQAFFAIAPHGHGHPAYSDYSFATNEGELVKWPPAAAKLVSEKWKRPPEYYQARYDANENEGWKEQFKGTSFQIGALYAAAFRLVAKPKLTLVTVTVQATRVDPSGTERQWWKELEWFWLDEDSGKVTPVKSDCTSGQVRDVLDLDRDDSPEVVVYDDRVPEDPPVFELCRWNGKKFARVPR